MTAEVETVRVVALTAPAMGVVPLMPFGKVAAAPAGPEKPSATR